MKEFMNLVVIRKNQYMFYNDRNLVVSVESDVPLSAEDVEYYREDFNRVYEALEQSKP